MKRSVADSGGASEDVRTLSDAAYVRLKADILWGRLAPDQALRSDQLRSTYDMGISPLREALTRLSTEGHVVSTGQRGFRVAPLTARQVRDTAEMRILVESEALRRAMALGDLAWESDIVAATHSLTRTLRSGELRPEGEAWSQQHRRYHMALIAACGSDLMMQTASVLFDHSERHRIVAEHRRMDIEASGAISRRDRIDEHEEVARTVLKRNTEAALSSLRRHYILTMDSVVAALEPSPEAVSPAIQEVRRKRVGKTG